MIWRRLLQRASLVLLIALTGCGRGGDEGEEAGGVVRQPVTVRVFDLEAVRPERLPVPYLMNPLILEVHAGTLFVLDFGDFRLKRFTLDGAPAGTLINGRGEGPGELQNPTDFVVGEDTVWVLDPNPRRIAVYRSDGTFIRNLPTVGLAIQMVRTGRQFMLLTLMSPHLLLQIDGEGQEVARFDHPLEERAMNRLALDGKLVPAPEGGFFYVPWYTGQFFHHAADGRLLKQVWTIDAFPLPDERASAEDRVVRAPKGGPIRTLDGYLHGEELHLYTFFRDDPPHGFQRVIDRYDVATGYYRGSIGVPSSIKAAVVHDGLLYGVADTTIVRFQLVPRRER